MDNLKPNTRVCMRFLLEYNNPYRLSSLQKAWGLWAVTSATLLLRIYATLYVYKFQGQRGSGFVLKNV